MVERGFFPALLARRGLVLIAALGLAIWGVAAFSRLPIDAFPDVTNTQVMVLTRAPGLAATDVEQRVSVPLELALRGLPRVLEVRSLSRPELSQVVVVFEDDAEPYWTRQVVFERLAAAREQLPDGSEPELGPLSTGLGEILQYTLASDELDSRELRTLQDWVIAPLLAPVPGVTEVNSFGGEVKQLQVLVEPDRLVAQGLTLAEVVTAVERNNANAGGGIVVRGWEQLYLRGVGLVRDARDLERTVVATREGSPLYLQDVATVTIGSSTRQGAVTRDGRGEVVAGMVIMLKDANSKEVVTAAKAALARIEGTLPAGVELDVFYDRTTLIEACIATVRDALLEGAFLVVLVLLLLMADARSALIVLVSLPLTFLVSFIVMDRIGLSSNLMSLGGLAFSVGMVVDASIVVVEHVRRRLAAAAVGGGGGAAGGARGVVAAATAEVARPVGFSIGVIAVILLPLFSLQGIEGKMFAPLALTLLIALLASLALSLTVVPVLAHALLRMRPERELRVVRGLRAGYLRLLAGALRHPRVTLGLALAWLVAAAALTPRLGSSFMPPLDEGALAINVVRLPNASLAGGVRVSDYLERRLREFPEVAAVVSKTGRAAVAEDPMGPEQTDLLVMLHPRPRWTAGRDRATLVSAIQAELATVPGLRFSYSQPIALRVNELVSGVKSDLAVKVFGPDLEVLRGFADRAAATLGGVPGAADVRVELVTGMNQIDAVIDRVALARHGLSVAAVNATIEAALAGREAGTLIEGEQRSAIVVRFPERERQDLNRIERLLVATPSGARVPLGELAPMSVVEAPAQISRENGMRRVVVEANVRGRDLGGFVAAARAALEPLERGLPPGYSVTYGGQYEHQVRALRHLAWVVPLALGLILGLLYVGLGSLTDSLLVLANLPFALVGGVLAALAYGIPLSVSAAVAFIVLLGIAVQNGVVLVAFFRALRAEGRELGAAVREGCEGRLRALTMTALTSFLGHLPMLTAAGAGADIQQPLAVVVMGGIVTSTLLTLVVLPVAYVCAHGGHAAPCARRLRCET